MDYVEFRRRHYSRPQDVLRVDHRVDHIPSLLHVG